MSRGKRKKPERSKKKYPNLKKQYNTKKRQDYIDQDYIDKLSDEEKAWLDKFNEEYVNAKFEKKGERYTKNNLHKGKKKRTDIYKDNYSRQNCLYNVAKTTKRLVSIETIYNKTENTDVEDALIDVIDAKNYVNKLNRDSLTKLAKSERKHNQMAKLRKNANKTSNNTSKSSKNKKKSK